MISMSDFSEGSCEKIIPLKTSTPAKTSIPAVKIKPGATQAAKAKDEDKLVHRCSDFEDQRKARNEEARCRQPFMEDVLCMFKTLYEKVCIIC